MPLSFENKKQLRFVITLATGTFGSANQNQITLEGYRSIADIDGGGGMVMGSLQAKIYGVSQSDMNSCVTLVYRPNNMYLKNTVEVYAIDGDQEAQVFEGNIVNAWGVYYEMPDVYLMIQAQAAYADKVSPASPRSYKGSVDAATIIKQISGSMGYAFENNGVSVQLRDTYLYGSNIDQLQQVVRAAGIDYYIGQRTVAICPKNTPRKSLIPLISKGTGLVGYPTFDGPGVNFVCLFNPAIAFLGQVKIESDIPQANGYWSVMGVFHRLEALIPGGVWQSRIRGVHGGLAVSK